MPNTRAFDEKKTIFTLKESHSTKEYTQAHTESYADSFLGNYRVLQEHI